MEDSHHPRLVKMGVVSSWRRALPVGRDVAEVAVMPLDEGAGVLRYSAGTQKSLCSAKYNITSP